MSTHWLQLEGTVNTRDVGGLPLSGGGSVRSGRLLRSDNLQDLTDGDVRTLLGLGLGTVIDLRSRVEVERTGPTALTDHEGVRVHHLSLFPGTRRCPWPSGRRHRRRTRGTPWQDLTGERAKASARSTYLRYLQDRPDSVSTALRLIAHEPGASLVHCAAGKDRTGVVVALALDAVGVDREAIVADYVLTGERIEAILARLMAAPPYAIDPALKDTNRHRPNAPTMVGFLDDLDATFGGANGFLRVNGWTEPDFAALRDSLQG